MLVILDRFLIGFKQRFPAQRIAVRASDSTVSIPCGNPAIGAIEVQDDLNELIVFVGDFTHGHFDCYVESLSPDEREEDVSRQVLDFLSDVFADKVEFYRLEHGGGGWGPAGTGPEDSFTWSNRAGSKLVRGGPG